MAKSQESEKNVVSNDCFVIMPIADQDGYDEGHFTKVYQDILKPACQFAGYKAVRADEVLQTNLIHLDILQKLIQSPMAICDLSARNPNVLFELGLRQAFDKPTVLVQEIGNPQIFDIVPLRYTEYRRELRYREVLEDQAKISEAIKATKEATDRGEGVNSIVTILSLSKPATLKDVNSSDSTSLLQLVRAEMSEMRSDFRKAMYMMERDHAPRSLVSSEGTISVYRLRTIRGMIQKVEEMLSLGAPKALVREHIRNVQRGLRPMLVTDAPEDIRNEALDMSIICKELELRLNTQSR